MWKESVVTYLKVLSWLYLEELRKIVEKSGNIDGVPAEIVTGDLLNTSQKCEPSCSVMEYNNL
jgi:hypothetical protein